MCVTVRGDIASKNVQGNNRKKKKKENKNRYKTEGTYHTRKSTPTLLTSQAKEHAIKAEINSFNLQKKKKKKKISNDIVVL